jgi:ankyrin repeat protein
MDDEEDNSIRDAFLREKMEDLGLDNNSEMKNYGKGTGLNPNPNDYQIKCIEKLASKIHISKSKAKQKDEEEEGLSFDILSEPRVILYEGKVYKKTRNSLVTNSSKRLLILLNDVILICSIQSSSGILNTSEKYSIHQIINLNECAITNLSTRSDQDEKQFSFELATSERLYTIITENEEDKLLWLDELEKAIFAIVTEESDKYHLVLKEAWQHTIVRGTFHSDAYYGRIDNLHTHIKKLQLEGKSLDIQDDSGNYPIHWACLQGHKECVEMLIDNGIEIDILNNSLNSPLLLASAGGHYLIVKYLIEQGSNFFLRNLKDRDALCLAVLYGSHSNDLYNILNYLKMNDVNVNQFDSSGSTCLHECAARSKGSRPVQILVDLGAEVELNIR